MELKMILLAVIVLSGAMAAPVVESEDGILSKALDLFGKGAFSMNNLKILVDDFKLVGELFRDFAEVSPFVRNIVHDAAEKDVKLKVIAQLLEGKYPDLGELFRLATTKSDIKTDMNQVLRKQPDFKRFQTITDGNFNSPQDLRQLAEILLGKTISKHGSALTDDALSDLYVLGQFVSDNVDDFRQMRDIVNNPPTNYVTLLGMLKKLPFEQVLSKMSSGAKYTVSSPNDKKKTHQIAEDLEAEFKTALNTPVTSTNAEKMVNSLVSLIGKLCENILVELGAQRVDNIPL